MSDTDASKRFFNPVGFQTSLPPALSKFDAVETVSVRYLTDRTRLQALLPDFFECPADPIILVSHAHNIGVDWLGGRTYHIARIDTQVTFRGREEAVTGNYSMIVWESDARPVIVGRELQGYQKIVGNVPPHVIEGKKASFECYDYDARLFRAELTDLTPIPGEKLNRMQEGWSKSGGNVALGWKYIPNPEGGADVDYVTRLPMEGRFSEVLTGKGEVVFDSPDWQSAPGSAHIIKALKTMPILEYKSAVITRMVDVMLPRDQVRKLQ